MALLLLHSRTGLRQRADGRGAEYAVVSHRRVVLCRFGISALDGGLLLAGYFSGKPQMCIRDSPSGIIGPDDLQGGSFTSMARSFLAGKLPFAVRGGYDFVDVRDVANGILACSESGEPGKGYILSGHYVTIRRMLQIIGAAAKRRYRPICLPLGLARLAAPYYERRSLKDRKPLFFTPYSISVLASNGCFSHAAASKCFAYQPRPLEQTLRDMAAWLIAQKEAGKALPHLIRRPTIRCV